MRARALAKSGAVAGLCPITEANLGDGIFEAPRFAAAGGRFAVGTDSNVRIALNEELRTLEYGQRLREQKRNRLGPVGASTGRHLFDTARRGGAQALGLASGALAVGQTADIVILDETHPALVGRDGDQIIELVDLRRRRRRGARRVCGRPSCRRRRPACAPR